MRLAFITDPLPTLKAHKDSSIAMMRAAVRRGHTVYAIAPHQLRVADGRVRALAAPLALYADRARWYEAGAAEDLPLTAFDVVAERKDPPFDLEYLYRTLLLERAEAEGVRVVNRPRALRDFNEKLAILRFPQFTAPTLVARDPAHIHGFIDEHADAVLKRLDGMGGSMIFRVRQDDPNRNVIVETMTDLGERTIMVQRYIPEIAQGDKRVLLIDGVPVPYALARIPKAGESRGNLAAGGRAEARPLSARDRTIAEHIGPKLAAEGLLLVGLDIIGDQLTEVNVTSPTCMVEIADQTGFDAAALWVEAIERTAGT
jgi:glutathione synthase